MLLIPRNDMASEKGRVSHTNLIEKNWTFELLVAVIPNWAIAKLSP